MKKLSLLSTLLMVLLLAGCGKDPGKYLSEAQKLIETKKYKDAIKVYETMIAEMPESDSLVVAYYNLGNLYRMPEVAETSKEKLKAVEYYRIVFDKFPKSEYAPVSLFNSGFIYGNELNDVKNATENYNLLIKNFPDHELTAIAKQDMEILGKSPEEILNEKLKEQEKKQGEKPASKEFVHP
ncbi:MAG: tetratricopeptide repeat protein [Ignavibacteriales bacterium]|jgi:TolA-binding protein|nr:tetratricopeptide repeat protein [Ignavibacteriales bacterium]MBK7266176.1 tetratricopeptide repeat protein [Ignavibacteriales bacterium]MBK8664082.1 tetratricopeptide repeat protein [Ignavibacteriales bacterium]MBP9122238.1 tetratricopeptide repeat protein [Ignavibacteriaceae bacterium]MCC6637806.1 tetratricopeptide repeat protein [Ignavibacteriaceae bacterium]